MSVSAIALRLLLSLVLILNGIGTANASIRMLGAMAMPAASSSVTAAAKNGAAPCLEHHAVPPGKSGAASDASGPAPDGCADPAPDCCESSACGCACMQSCAFAVPAVAQPMVVIARDPSIRAMSLGHPAPTLPHLIRPPIA
ncbi:MULTISPECIES: CopL family metal-binding regulatory protein [Lysobacter]|uniref:CopL family metal-binding regulatory protein n=1 Tax=Lysobacter TaxID=68 RepID=UPI00137718B2|nr:MULTISPECIES: CopL family metal-binding regulatory protein [Lysobacter]